MKVYTDIQQGSEDWLKIRCGKITASRFSDVMAKGRGSSASKTRLSYIYDIVAEKLTQQPAEQYTNKYMEWGNQCEPLAREYYKHKTGSEIKQIGFVEMSGAVGCSPDSLVDDNGLLEIKCPKTTTQIQRHLEGVFPEEYKPQVQGQLWICDREWCDFVSFDPRILNEKKMFKIRVYRDEPYIKQIIQEINHFIDDVNSVLEKMN